MSSKTFDTKTMPMCWLCHHDFHTLAGRFKGWSKEQLRVWQDEQIQDVLTRRNREWTSSRG